jgi:alpha-galactosidase
MWAIMKGPLLLGTDLTKLKQEQIALLQNKDLLAFNQDPIVGKPARPYKWGINKDYTFNSTVPAMYWSGSSSNGTIVALMNPLGGSRKMSAVFSEIPQLKTGTSYNVVSVWDGKNLGCVGNSVNVTLAGYDTAVYLVGAKC